MNSNFKETTASYYRLYRAPFMMCIEEKFPYLAMAEAREVYRQSFLSLKKDVSAQGSEMSQQDAVKLLCTTGLTLASKIARKNGTGKKWSKEKDLKLPEFPSPQTVCAYLSGDSAPMTLPQTLRGTKTEELSEITGERVKLKNPVKLMKIKGVVWLWTTVIAVLCLIVILGYNISEDSNEYNLTTSLAACRNNMDNYVFAQNAELYSSEDGDGGIDDDGAVSIEKIPDLSRMTDIQINTVIPALTERFNRTENIKDRYEVGSVLALAYIRLHDRGNAARVLRLIVRTTQDEYPEYAERASGILRAISA